jgi:hypothetical protein
MKETRTFKIENRIFTIQNVKKIAAKFESEYQSAKAKQHHATVRFLVLCKDGSLYESEDSKIFDDSVISSKKVQVFNFSFTDYEEDKNMRIELEHGNDSYRNSFVVSGKDSDWVNGTLNSLQVFIESATPQSTWFKRLKVVFTLLLSFLIGISLVALLGVIGRKLASKSFINPFRLMMEEPNLIWGSLFIGYFPAFFITDFFNNLWPKVEIQVGPGYTFLEKNKRKLLFGLITILVLPIILGLIFSN